jgi:protein-tyrosine phosphatase
LSDLLRFPIRDVDVTDDAAGLRKVLGDIHSCLEAGKRVVIACRGGLGRTGTVVACLLRDAGLDPDAAIAATRSARRGAIETPEQERFVRDWGGPLP